MQSAYCLVQNGDSDASSAELIASVLSIKNVDAEALVCVSCTDKCKTLLANHPLLDGHVEYSIQDSSRGLDAFLSRTEGLARDALSTGRHTFIVSAGVLIVRPLRPHDSLVDQGIGFIDRRPYVHECHVAVHFLSDVIYLGRVEWLDRYIDMCRNVSDLKDESWYETVCEAFGNDDPRLAHALAPARLVERHGLSKFIDSRSFFCSDCFTLMKDSWKMEEVDQSLSRHGHDICFVSFKRPMIEFPGGSEMFTAMLGILTKKDPYYIMLLPMTLAHLSQGISYPCASELRAWNRREPVSRVGGFIDSLCSTNYFSKAPPVEHALYYTLGTCIIYDDVTDGRATPHLAGGRRVIHGDYDDTLLSVFNQGNMVGKGRFLGYLPHDHAALSFHDQLPVGERKHQMVKLADLPPCPSDEEYTKAILRIRSSRFAVVASNTTYVAEALYFGVVPLLSKDSVSTLISLDEGVHFLKSDSGDEVSEEALGRLSRDGRAFYKQSCSRPSLTRKLLNVAFVRHIEGGDLKCESEVPVIGVHDATDIVEESDS